MTDKTKGTKIKLYRREIPIILTEKEIHDYGQKLASKKRERDVLTEKAKATAAEYKGQIATTSSEIDRLANAINSGRELRSTEVEDYLAGAQVFTYALGSSEVIDQRPAGFADEQTDLFDTGDDDKPDANGEFQSPEPTPPTAKKPRKKKA